MKTWKHSKDCFIFSVIHSECNCYVSEIKSQAKQIESLQAEVEGLKHNHELQVHKMGAEINRQYNKAQKAESKVESLQAREARLVEVMREALGFEDGRDLFKVHRILTKALSQSDPGWLTKRKWESVEEALEWLGFPEGSVEYAQVKKEWATRLSPDEETRCDVTCQGVQVGKSCNCKKDYSMGAYLEKTTKEDIEWIAGCDEPKPDSTDGGK